MSGVERQRRHRDRLRSGMHVSRPLAIPDADLIFKLVELGLLSDVENRDKIDAALEAWVTQLVTPGMS